MIAGANKFETFTKHILCKFKYKFDGRNNNSYQ